MQTSVNRGRSQRITGWPPNGQSFILFTISCIKFKNLGRGLHGHDKYAFSFSQIYTVVKRKLFLRLNAFALYGHFGPALGPECLTFATRNFPIVVDGS